MHVRKIILAKLAVGMQEFKSTNVKLTANNNSLTTLANRRWSNMFSLSPRRRGRSNLDNVSNPNTSSTVNSYNNLSTSSRDMAIHKATSAHGEASRTEVGAISVALPVMLCGLTVNNVLQPKAQSTQANEPKNSVDDNAEQRIIMTSNLGTEIKRISPRFLLRNFIFVCVSRFRFEKHLYNSSDNEILTVSFHSLRFVPHSNIFTSKAFNTQFA